MAIDFKNYNFLLSKQCAENEIGLSVYMEPKRV